MTKKAIVIGLDTPGKAAIESAIKFKTDVMDIGQTKESIQEQEFNKYLHSSPYFKGFRFIKDSEFIPAILRRLGIYTFAKLETEHCKINAKESQLSRTNRDAVQKAYKVVQGKINKLVETSNPKSETK